VSDANLDLVYSIYADWERRDFSRADWADPEIEYMLVGGPEPGSGSGLARMATGWGVFLSAWEDFRVEVDDYRQLDESVLHLESPYLQSARRRGRLRIGFHGTESEPAHARSPPQEERTPRHVQRSSVLLARESGRDRTRTSLRRATRREGQDAT
jgi:hypothetical protein